MTTAVISGTVPNKRFKFEHGDLAIWTPVEDGYVVLVTQAALHGDTTFKGVVVGPTPMSMRVGALGDFSTKEFAKFHGSVKMVQE